jgi:EAL and modified HD-GYP domain-containing signal transduction protein
MKEVRKWTSLAALSGMGEDRPSALMISLVIRARFCEALAALVGQQAKALDLFLMGLLSMVDTVLERPLSEILQQLAISDEVKTALLSGGNQMRQILDLVVATEKGQWPRMSFLASALKIAENSVTEAYLQAIQWSHQVFDIDQTALSA